MKRAPLVPAAAGSAADVEVEVEEESMRTTTLDDRQTMSRIHYKAQRWTDNAVKFDPSSWRETFSKLNSNPRLGGKLFQIKFEPSLLAGNFFK